MKKKWGVWNHSKVHNPEGYCHILPMFLVRLKRNEQEFHFGWLYWSYAFWRISLETPLIPDPNNSGFGCSKDETFHLLVSRPRLGTEHLLCAVQEM